MTFQLARELEAQGVFQRLVVEDNRVDEAREHGLTLDILRRLRTYPCPNFVLLLRHKLYYSCMPITGSLRFIYQCAPLCA